MAATILTPADLAAELGTDARTARKFLRSITPKDAQPGKGSRWGIEKKNLRSLRTKFTAFQNAENARKAERDEKAAQNEADAEFFVEALLNEPTDEELAMIDDEN